MSPADLHLVLTALPWNEYTPAELNQMAAIFSKAHCQVIAQRAAIRAREQAAQIEQRRLLAEHRPREELTRAVVFPPGTRFE